MSSRTPPDVVPQPRSWSLGDFNVFSDTSNANLADLQNDPVTGQIADVRCCYCSRSVIWEMPANSSSLRDVRVFTRYHKCETRFNEFGACNPPRSGLTLTQLRAVFADYANLGFAWVRTDITWTSVQATTAPVYTFSNYDDFVQAAHENGVKVLLILDYSHPLFNGNHGDKTPPTSNSDFANYVTAVVTRYYAQGVTDYEIWNEQNISTFWQPSPDPVGYTALLKAAYVAAKAVSPSINVIAGGTALASVGENTPTHLSAPDFLSVMYQQGAKAYFDAFNYHPYGWLPKVFDAIRAVMYANGDSTKRLWLTEYGNPTSGAVGQQFVTEQQQSDLAVIAISNVRAVGYMGPMLFYKYKDDQAYGAASPDREGYFGILRSDGTRKPAYDAIRAVIATRV